jgi:hypothetical protein
MPFRFGRFIILIVALVAMLAIPSQVAADDPPTYTKTWIGTDNFPYSYGDPNNWNPPGVPVSGDIVYADGLMKGSVELSGITFYAGGLTMQGPDLVIDSSSLLGSIDGMWNTMMFYSGTVDLNKFVYWAIESDKGINFVGTGPKRFHVPVNVSNQNGVCGPITYLAGASGLDSSGSSFFLKGMGDYQYVGLYNVQYSSSEDFAADFTLLKASFLRGRSDSSGHVIGNLVFDTGSGFYTEGILNVTGDFSCLNHNPGWPISGPSMYFYIGGTSPGNSLDSYSQLNVTGFTSITDTELRLRLVNDFVPSIGDKFTLITSNSGTFDFSSFDLPTLPEGYSWKVNTNSNNVELEVVGAGGLNGINPGTCQAGRGDLGLTANGKGFTNESVLTWRDLDTTTALPTNFVSSTQLTATIPASLISSTKTADVYVDIPGVGVTNLLPFFVTDTGTALTSSDVATSTNGTATAAISGSLSAAASGSGTVAVAQYASDPGGTPSFTSTGSFFDVYASQDSNFNSINIIVNNLNGGDCVYWWNGAAWIPASDQTYDPESNSVTVTVNSSTIPNLSDLHGSAFGVARVVPNISGIGANPSAPIAVGTPMTLSTSFTDSLGSFFGPFNISIDWDDQSALSTSSTQDPGSINLSHTYSAAGVYSPKVTITDRRGIFAVSAHQYVVAYDANGGFVTGGGWINSPAGAYPAAPTMAGKATFGFESKYKKGAIVPTGNTEFQFHAGNLNFKSTSYDWLVVNQAGANAQFKGTGTLNGEGSYKFMLWATDGTQDTFHIKIWGDNEGAPIYDNGKDQVISGGSIIVHKAK